MTFDPDLDIPADQDAADRVVSDMRSMVTTVAGLRRSAMELTARALSPDRRITVWVNASGVVIQTELDRDVFEEYTPDALGTQITETAQEAAAAVKKLVDEKVAEINAATGVGDLTRILRDVPGLDELTKTVEPSTASPTSEQRMYRGDR